MKRFSRRSVLFPAFIATTAVLALLLLGPTLLARAQVNLFSADLARLWTRETLIPTDAACPPAKQASLRAMQEQLKRIDEADAHASLHRGQLACLQGDVNQAGDIWLAGQNAAYVTDSVQFLDAAIAKFTEGDVLETDEAKAIGKYASKQGAASEREKDLPTAAGWYEMAFAYAPDGKIAGKLASIYKKLGQNEKITDVWERLQAQYPTDSPEYWWAMGQALEQGKNWDGALEAYLKAGALETDAKKALRDYLRAGGMGLRSREFEKAEEAYQKAIATAPDKIDGYLGMGHVYRYQQRYDEAAEWYRKAIEIQPDNYVSYYYLATIARSEGNYQKSLDYLNKSLALRANNASALYQKSLTLDMMGERGNAINVLSQAIALHKNPPPEWRSQLEQWRKYPDADSNPALWWQLGQEAEKGKDWEKASEMYKLGAAIAIPPDDYRFLLQRGRMLRRLGELADASAVLKRAIEKYPDKADPYIELGDIVRNQKDYDKAIALFQKAHELAPDDHRPLLYLGLISRSQEHYEQALVYLQEALAIKPDSRELLYYQATVLDALGRREEAIDSMQKAIAGMASPPEDWSKLLAKWQRYPTTESDPAYWAALAREAEKTQDWQKAADLYQKAVELAQGKDAYPYLIKLGYMFIRERAYERAEQAYKQALTLEPESIDALLGIGETYRYRKEYSEAERWYRQAQKVAPDNFRPPYHLGMALYYQKRYDEALKSLDRSLSMHPENAWGQYFRAFTLRALGRNKEALSSLEKAIDMHPNSPESWKNLLNQWREQ